MISLNYGDARPIYEQIRDGLRRLVVTGALPEGERLPSVRSLATSLAINPNTIQRAYNELETEGYITSVPGKGSFAAPRRVYEENRLMHLLGQLDALVQELKVMGMDEGSICARICARKDGKEGGKQHD